MKNSKTILMLSAAGLFLFQGLSLAETIEGRIVRIGPGDMVSISRLGGTNAGQQIHVSLKAAAKAQDLKEGDQVTLEATQDKASSKWEATTIKKSREASVGASTSTGVSGSAGRSSANFGASADQQIRVGEQKTQDTSGKMY